MLRNFCHDLQTAAIAIIGITLLCGLAYPYLITGIAQLFFNDKADGSIVTQSGGEVGSSLIGQSFVDAKYFSPRPSAADYNAANSKGSNLGPTNANLMSDVATRVAGIRERDGIPQDQPVPVDAVTTSGSGLDPHISPAYAEMQIPRVAAARGMTEEQVRALVQRYTDGATFGIFGQERVNVLLLNLALDEETSQSP